MTQVILVSNIVEKNGKTVRENNLELVHNIPLGTLVEVDCDYIESHGIRAFVVEHSRDCDGEPLYSLSLENDVEHLNWIKEQNASVYRCMISGGFSDECLKIIRLPKD